MNTKPTNTLLRLFISIAITVGVVLVYAKPLPDNDQAAGGYLIQQQQQPNAGEEFVIAYGGGGGDIPNSNNGLLDSPTELNTHDPSLSGGDFFLSNPTPTIQEDPTLAGEGGKLIAFDWLENFREGIREKLGPHDPEPAPAVVTVEAQPSPAAVTVEAQPKYGPETPPLINPVVPSTPDTNTD